MKKPTTSKTVCFEALFRKQRCGSSWARVSETGRGAMTIECRQVMFDLDAAGLHRSRRQSTHTFDKNGHLVSAHIKDYLGNRIAIRIKSGKMHIGDQSRPVDDPITFVLEQNMVALSVVLLESAADTGGAAFVALAPETGTFLPYSIQRQGAVYQSNLGETFAIGPDGMIETMRPSASDFVFKRASRRFPAWSLDAVCPVLEYRPPGHIWTEEKKLRLGGNKAPAVEATLARPLDGNRAIAAGVFIGGTGVYDRHGVSAGFDVGYHQLLDDLAAQGVSSLRYEKFSPDAASLEEAEGRQGFDDLCDQANRGLSWLSGQSWTKKHPRIAIGHSLGGLVALALAGRGDDLDMIVLLNTPGRTLREVTKDQHGWFLQQSEASPKASKESAALRRDLIKALESDKEWNPDTVDGRILALKRKRKLYRDILDLDPCVLVKQGACPVIIVQGTTDIQVSTTDAHRLARACETAQRPYRLLLADGLDHLLKRNAETGLKALRVYRDRRRRVPIALIRQIAETVRQIIPNPQKI